MKNKMKEMQSEVLPTNWLKIVEEFDENQSNLSKNNKIILTYLIAIILEEQEKSLTVPLLKYLIEHIVLRVEFVFTYDNLPQKLIKDTFNEIKKERGIYLERKLHSINAEIHTYQSLYSKCYTIVDSTRTKDSCDLIMEKHNRIYNFEVKFKESKDIGISRLYNYIDGYSLLQKNEFLRSRTFEINLKIDSLNYSNLQGILGEIDIFIANQEDIYDGENLQIFDSKKRSQLNRDINQVAQYLDNFHIQIIDDVESLINKIFIENNGHLTKLIKKSKKYKLDDNFIGCLVWSIPFHMNIDNDKIKKAFEKINLDFDLFVYTGGIEKDEFNFFVPKKKGDI